MNAACWRRMNRSLSFACPAPGRLKPAFRRRRRLAALLAIAAGALLSSSGCGPSVPSPEEPSIPEVKTNSSPVASAASEPSPSGNSPSPAAGPAKEGSVSYKLAWISETKNWNHGVAIAPFGDVISLGGHTMAVHAQDSGKILEQAEVCHGILTNGFAFIDASKGIVVCEDEIREVVFPGLLSRTVVKLPSEAEATALAGHLVAVGDRQGQVTVYGTETWTPVDQFTIKGEVESLAMALDGSRVAAGGRAGHLELRDLTAKKSSVLAGVATGRVSALGFSPDGKELFGEFKSFDAGAIDIEKRAVIRHYEISSWLTSVRYLSRTLVAATGAHGFALFPADSSAPQPLNDGNGGAFEGLGASADGSLVCGGDRSGRIACFASRALSPSTYKPAARTAAGAGSTASGPSAAAAPGPEIAGRIASRKGNVITVRTASAPAPAVDARGTLYRRFEQQIGPMRMGGWLEVAKVTVKKSAADTIEIIIAEEKSNITVNGKKVDHFASGTEVKIELSP
jgi:hypothetical protein